MLQLIRGSDVKKSGAFSWKTMGDDLNSKSSLSAELVWKARLIQLSNELPQLRKALPNIFHEKAPESVQVDSPEYLEQLQ